MDSITCIKSRRSVRRFQNKPVPRELITQAVSAAQFAPTWKNSQTVRYFYVDDPALKAEISEKAVMGFAKNRDNINNAAGLMVVTSVHGISGYDEDGTPSSGKGSHWESFDAGLGVQTLCLALHDVGLGSVIMGLFDPDLVAQMVNIPHGQLVSCILAVGYPAEGEHGNPRRKPLEEVLFFG